MMFLFLERICEMFHSGEYEYDNFYFFSELEGILSENKTNIKIKIQIILVIKRIYSFE